MERGVAEQVAEVLKQLQQLVRGVLEDGQHLGGHHVVHHEERRLGEGGGRLAVSQWFALQTVLLTAGQHHVCVGWSKVRGGGIEPGSAPCGGLHGFPGLPSTLPVEGRSLSPFCFFMADFHVF